MGAAPSQPFLASMSALAATYPGGSARLRNVTGSITWGPMVIVDPVWDRVNNEIVFFKVGVGSNFEYDLNFNIYIAFDEPDAIRGQPIVPALNAMASEVNRIVLATEAEGRRLGIIP